MLLAQGLTERAVRVTLVTKTPAGGMDDTRLPFRIVRQPRLPVLWRLFRTTDLIHLAGPCLLPMLMGLACRKPLVLEHHGYQAVCPNGLLLYEPTKTVCPDHFMAHRYHKCLKCNASTMPWTKSVLDVSLVLLRRWACQRAAVNLPISQHVSSRIRLSRSKVIYYGIMDPMGGRSASTGDRTAPSIPTPMTYAYVGRLVSEKGLPILLLAASQLLEQGYNFRLKMIGDGPERANLETMVAGFGLQSCVGFTGQLQGDALHRALEEVSVVVMPSLWEETAGLAAIEQMMRGRMVIASNIGGLGEVVDGVGLKFAPGDAAGLASCLRRVLDDPGLVEVLGRKARQRALELFLQQRMVAEHLALYRELLGDSSPPSIFASEEA